MCLDCRLSTIGRGAAFSRCNVCVGVLYSDTIGMSSYKFGAFIDSFRQSSLKVKFSCEKYPIYCYSKSYELIHKNALHDFCLMSFMFVLILYLTQNVCALRKCRS